MSERKTDTLQTANPGSETLGLFQEKMREIRRQQVLGMGFAGKVRRARGPFSPRIWTLQNVGFVSFLISLSQKNGVASKNDTPFWVCLVLRLFYIGKSKGNNHFGDMPISPFWVLILEGTAAKALIPVGLITEARKVFILFHSWHSQR